MAAPAAGASERFQDALSCEVCAELYEETVKIPLVLPCGHTFCRPCLTKIGKSGNFHCPTCRVGHNNLLVDKLTVNYSLLSILPLCNLFKCDTCTTHGDDLRYWCVNCDLSLCSICLHSDHPRTHTVKLAQTFVKEKNKKLEERLNVVLQNIDQQKKALKKGFNDVDAVVVQLFSKNAHLNNTEVGVGDLLDDIRKANDIASVLSYEKVVEELQFRRDMEDPNEKAQEKAQSSRDALVKERNFSAADKDTLLVTSEKRKRKKQTEAGSIKAAKRTEPEICMPSVRGQEALVFEGRGLISASVTEQGGLMPSLSVETALLSGKYGLRDPYTAAEVTFMPPVGGQNAIPVSTSIAAKSTKAKEETEAPRAVMDYRDGRLLLHTLALPASTRLSLQVPHEVFLELGVGDRCLGRVYIRLWLHLRRAHQFLALCMGTMGPSLLGARASGKVRHIIEFRSAVDRNMQSVSHALLTGLEWGGQHCEPQAEGLVTGMSSYDHRVYEAASGMASYNTRGYGVRTLSNEDMAFGICTQEHPGMNVNAAFGEVVAGLEVAKEAFQHNPVSEVTITSCGLVLPGLSQQG